MKKIMFNNIVQLQGLPRWATIEVDDKAYEKIHSHSHEADCLMANAEEDLARAITYFTGRQKLLLDIRNHGQIAEDEPEMMHKLAMLNQLSANVARDCWKALNCILEGVAEAEKLGIFPGVEKKGLLSPKYVRVDGGRLLSETLAQAFSLTGYATRESGYRGLESNFSQFAKMYADAIEKRRKEMPLLPAMFDDAAPTDIIQRGINLDREDIAGILERKLNKYGAEEAKECALAFGATKWLENNGIGYTAEELAAYMKNRDMMAYDVYVARNLETGIDDLKYDHELLKLCSLFMTTRELIRSEFDIRDRVPLDERFCTIMRDELEFAPRICFYEDAPAEMQPKNQYIAGGLPDKVYDMARELEKPRFGEDRSGYLSDLKEIYAAAAEKLGIDRNNEERYITWEHLSI